MKDFFVSDAPRFDNAVVTSYFALSSLQVREKKSNGDPYLVLLLTDKTGSLEARMWDEVAPVLEHCAEGCYVKVQGQISRYNSKFQITISKMRHAADSEIDPADYVPTTQFNIDEMWSELHSYVTDFKNQDLRRLVFGFLDDPSIAAAYREAPAAKMLHHAWLGGLLEHVLTLVRVCRATAPFYPEVDPDLLVTGAILHDIGKIRELSWKNSFSYTLEGQLIGHINIAQGMLTEKVRQLAPFPDNLRILVEHMILSHHGKYEFGSPKLPMTPEALLLNVLDDLEAKMQAMRNEFARAQATGRGPGEMTDWVRSLERPLFNSRAYLQEKGDEPKLVPSQSSESTSQPELESNHSESQAQPIHQPPEPASSAYPASEPDKA
jgi:3'-5' exoribonuclease